MLNVISVSALVHPAPLFGLEMLHIDAGIRRGTYLHITFLLHIHMPEQSFVLGIEFPFPLALGMSISVSNPLLPLVSMSTHAHLNSVLDRNASSSSKVSDAIEVALDALDLSSTEADTDTDGKEENRRRSHTIRTATIQII